MQEGNCSRRIWQRLILEQFYYINVFYVDNKYGIIEYRGFLFRKSSGAMMQRYNFILMAEETRVKKTRCYKTEKTMRKG